MCVSFSIHPRCCLDVSSKPKQIGNTLFLVQGICLLPQNIGPEPSESSRYSFPGFRIPIDCSERRTTAGEKASLTTNEETTEAKEGICSDIAECGGPEEGSDIRDCF